jgi:protein involved in polysaccharide export with SLBB domain
MQVSRSSIFSNFAWLLCLFLQLSVGLTAQQGADQRYSRMDLLDQERIIGYGDRLRYQVLEEQSAAVVLPINDRGEVRFPPLAQSIPAAGKTCFQLARELKLLLEEEFFFRATVIVELVASNFQEYVTVYGEVRSQGRVAIPTDASLMASQALAHAGGAMDGANLNQVVIVRRNLENPDKEERLSVDLDAVMRYGKVDQDLQLLASDVMIVSRKEELGGKYSVLGAVNSPGLYTIKDDKLTVSDAILMAGGFTQVARETRVKLTRQDSDSEEVQTFFLNVRKILEDGMRQEDMRVLPGDIIHVSERIIVF